MELDLTPYRTLDESSFRAVLKHLDDNYHNGIAIVSDQTYDDLIDLFEERFGEYLEVGAVPIGMKVKLPYYLGSLRKLKNIAELDRWTKNYPGPYVIQDKVDGLTLLYQIKNGVRKLYTRGGGIEGLDVSHMIPFLKLPHLNYDLAVRGEIVMFKETFQKLGEGFANARNMVSGIVNRKESFDPEMAKQLHFMAFRVMDSKETPEVQMVQLAMVGFETPWAAVSATITIEELNLILAARAEQAPYEIDGLVIYQNRVEEYPEGEKPRHVIAYKGIGAAKETTVREVIWQASMARKLKPVVIYDPVFLSGATLTKTGADNARFIIENGIGPGTIIKVTRSGATIPRIVEVVKPTEPSLPDPKVYGSYQYNGVELVMDQENDEVKAAKIEHFLETLGVKGIGPGRIKKMIDAGIKTIGDLVRATPQKLVNVPGFGSNLANQTYQEIQKKITGVTLSKIMAASTLFPNFGENRLEVIISAYPNILEMETDPELGSKIQQLHGFDQMAFDFVQLLPAFKDWLLNTPEITLQAKTAFETNPEYMNLIGKTFVFSGFRDKDLEEKIKSRGGRVTSAVSRNTTALIMKDLSDMKGKAEKAQQLGIPIISVQDFIRSNF